MSAWVLSILGACIAVAGVLVGLSIIRAVERKLAAAEPPRTN